MFSNSNNAPIKRKLVFKHVQVTTEYENDYSLLQLFVEDPREKEDIKKLADWLVSKNIDVNDKDWHLSLQSKSSGNLRIQPDETTDKDAFKYEIARELKNILPFLLNCNDDINYTTDDGQTILHVYLANDESCYKYLRSTMKPKIFKIVKTLLEMGASVDAVDKSGKTPLHIAVENKKFEVVELMMDFFSNVDACDEQGNTVLHTTVNRSLGNDGLQVKECSSIVQALLSKGADPNRKNQRGLTPVQLAANKYNVDVLQIFTEHGGDFGVLTDSGENLLLLVYRDNWYVGCNESMIVKTIDFVVNQGCDVNIKDKNGYSPLHCAAQWDRAVERLVELGADVNCQTKEGQRTPLHLAALNLKSKRIKAFRSTNRAVGALLSAGAYWDAVDHSGRTPFHYVLESGNVDNMMCFLQFGADINDDVVSSLIMNVDERLQRVAFIHAVTLKAVGFPVAKVYEPHLDSTLDLREGYKECVEAVNKLKTYMIGNGVSIYRFLHMNWRRQLSYVECLPRDLVSKFLPYHNLIQTVCREAIRRNQLLDSAKLAWYQITKSNLPDICVEHIFCFLNNWSLKALVDAAEKCCDDTST